jgi:hypothetical protein
MKLTKVTLGLIAALSMGVASEAALAYGHGGGYGGWHGGGYGGGHVGVYIGGPLVWPGYFGPYPYYTPYYSPYYPPAVTVPTAPTTYVEQGPDTSEAPSPQQSQAYWYYCPNSKSYYPYVRQCASSWRPVTPQPQQPPGP